jgi:CheY-like chemotaxis protein
MVVLPRVDVPTRSEPAAARPAPVPAPASETVLVLEDEEALREVVVDQLQYAGYAVVSGPTPEAAIEAAARHEGTIDLVITDVVMPGLSGRQAIDRVRALYPSIRVIYMSGYTSAAAGVNGAIESGQAFLQKPFSLQDLMRRVREVLHAVPQKVG